MQLSTLTKQSPTPSTLNTIPKPLYHETPLKQLKPKSWRWGWVFLKRTRILSGIQFMTHFIEFVVVESQRFVSSTVNVISTQHKCGQRSIRAATNTQPQLKPSREILNAISNPFILTCCYLHCRNPQSFTVCLCLCLCLCLRLCLCLCLCPCPCLSLCVSLSDTHTSTHTRFP